VVSLAVIAWLGWQKHTFLDPDTWYVQGPKLWWPLCVSEPVQMHAFLIHCSLVIFLLCFPHDPCFFCAAMMTRTYISRCWDFVQGPKFDELCACLSQCTFIHCVSSMILICCPWCIHSELGLNFVLLVHVWWQFVYQMMLLDACFFCFLDSSNRSSCSRPIYRTVLDGVWHCKKKKSVMPKWMFESSEPELIVLIHFASLVLLSRHHGDKYYHRCSELSD